MVARRGRPLKPIPGEAELRELRWQRQERKDRINDAIRRGGWPTKRAFLDEHGLHYSSLYHWEMNGDPKHGPPKPEMNSITQEFLAAALKIPAPFLTPGGPKIYEQAV